MKESIRPDFRIVNDFSAKNKDTIFTFLAKIGAEMAAVKTAGITTDEIIHALHERENFCSTELGNGLFFPHARFANLEKLSVVIAIPSSGSLSADEFQEPVKVICLVLIPEKYPMLALKFIASIANCIRTPERMAQFLQLLQNEEIDKLSDILAIVPEKSLCAGDLMRQWRCEVTPEMPLCEATRMMLSANASVVPVIQNGKLVGELSCIDLFKLGIPDFFTKLKSVGFIRNFDPFENYFSTEANSNVGDIMKTDIVTFDLDATLIEIVFAIVVEKIPLIYITDSNRQLLGIIDQTVLLERIINL